MRSTTCLRVLHDETTLLCLSRLLCHSMLLMLTLHVPVKITCQSFKVTSGDLLPSFPLCSVPRPSSLSRVSHVERDIHAANQNCRLCREFASFGFAILPPTNPTSPNGRVMFPHVFVTTDNQLSSACNILQQCHSRACRPKHGFSFSSAGCFSFLCYAQPLVRSD